jgi:hypothetical protein
MSLNFPSSPTPGQTYTAEGVTFVWNGTVWAAPPAGLIFATQAEAEAGSLWDRAMSPLSGAQAIAALFGLPPAPVAPEAVCVALCVFDGITGQIFAQKNIASLSGANTGKYTLMFQSPQPDTNFTVFGTACGVTNHPLIALSQTGTSEVLPDRVTIQTGTSGGNLTSQGGFLVSPPLVHAGVFR